MTSPTASTTPVPAPDDARTEQLVRRVLDRQPTKTTTPAIGAFSAYRNGASSLATGNTCVFDTELRDYSGWYATSTGIYTPQIPGVYRLEWCIAANAALAADKYWFTVLLKDGAEHKAGQLCFQRGVGQPAWSVGTCEAESDGTNQFKVKVVHDTAGSVAILANAAYTYFQGSMAGTTF